MTVRSTSGRRIVVSGYDFSIDREFQRIYHRSIIQRSRDFSRNESKKLKRELDIVRCDPFQVAVGGNRAKKKHPADDTSGSVGLLSAGHVNTCTRFASVKIARRRVAVSKKQRASLSV